MQKIGEKVNLAKSFASDAHQGQIYGSVPYIQHLEETYQVAVDHGLDEEIQCGCWLHDTLEDTKVTYSELVDIFGVSIAEMVYCVTDELGRNRKERKEKTYPKIASNPESIAVKLCDRIANIENAIKHGEDGLLKMYLKEDSEFQKYLFNEEYLPLWNRYLDLLNKSFRI